MMAAMGTATTPAARGWRTWLADRGLRTKILGGVLVAVLGTGLVVGSGTLALRSTGDQANRLYTHTALPLADLAQVRDGIGDSRRDIRDLAVRPAATQADLLTQIHDTDQAIDTALDAYQHDHGGSLGATNKAALAQVRAGLVTWRGVRDSQVVPAARRGDTAVALRIVSGPLTEADATYADPLDALFAQEKVVASAEATAARRAASRNIKTMIAIGGVAALLATAVGLIVARVITNGVGRMVEVLHHVGNGDLTRRANLTSRDEIGAMAIALDRATDAMQIALTTVSTTATSLDGSSEELSTISARIATSAQQSANQATSVSAATDEITDNVATLAAGSEQMGASIAEIAHSAAEAAKVAAQAVALSQSTTQTIGDLDASSTQIGEVIKMITAIAEQTNLLALNATIEAARAGDAGKGFAIVASEVKDLARETAKATDSISQLVGVIQSNTGAAVAATTQISEIIQRVSDFQTTIASAVEEQTATTTEMSRNVTQAANSSADISQQITAVASEAQTTTAGVDQAQQAAAQLAQLSAQLRHAVDHFTI
jgi:methyl-accepting chemotaxis protein